MAKEEFGAQSKKRPFGVIIILILLVALLVPLTIYTISYVNELRTKALPTESPQDIELTNVSGTSVTISWSTPSQKTVGYVKYGTTSKLGEVAFDKRDEGSASGEFSLHYVELAGLTPSTKYYYVIVVGGKEYKRADEFYDFETGPVLETISTPLPIKGDVEDPSGGDEELIVLIYARKENEISSKLSALTSNKRYSFDLSNLRSADLEGAFTDLDGATLYCIAEGAERGEGEVEAIVRRL